MLATLKSRFFLLCFFIVSQCLAHAEEKTLLVTGGAGFIGSHFVQHMFNKYPDYRIIVLDALTYSATSDNIPESIRSSPRFSFVHGSICDKAIVSELLGKSDFVVHFAAESDVTRSICDDEIFYQTNVMGTRNLMHYLVKHKDKVQRFVHISSSEVYGTCEKEEIDEDHPLNPMSPYAASKAGADRTVYAYGCTYDLPVVILRFFNNYGPSQHLEKVVAKFITHALTKQPISIHGSGEQMRDWLYVMDTARAIDAALHVEHFDSIKNTVINCGTGCATSIKTIAETICLIANYPPCHLVYTADRPGQVHKHLSSTQKAKELLGWEALTSLEEGLIRTIAWYQQHPEFWEKEIGDPQIKKDNQVLISEKMQSE